MTASSVGVELWAGEVVAPGSVIHLRFPCAVDGCQIGERVRVLAQGADQQARVEVSEDGLQAEVHLPECLRGACELVLRDLRSAEGKSLSAPRRIPFSAFPVPAQIAREHRVAHALRVTVGELSVARHAPETANGPFMDVLKVLPRAGEGGRRELAVDHRGEPVDFAAGLAGLAERRAERFGKVHEVLFERMQRSAADEKIDVEIWAKVSIPSAPFEKSTHCLGSEPHPRQAKLMASLRRRVKQLHEALQELCVEPRTSSGRRELPFVRARATVAQLRRLAQRPEVGGLFYDDPVVHDDFVTSIALSHADRVHKQGFVGEGIRVALWEAGPDDKKGIELAAQYKSDVEPSFHASLTAAIIRNVRSGKPDGYAPGCSLVSANVYERDALDWAVNKQGCTVVNQSFHWQSQAQSAEQQQYDLWCDYQVFFEPHPLIVQAAGNLGEDGVTPAKNEFVNHKGFNTLTVGSHGEHLELTDYSVTRNPSSFHGDRELPTLTASGTTLDATGDDFKGTSFSAPAVAGVAALLQGASELLRAWPEACRAILMAAAQRDAARPALWQEINSATDVGDGAGALDAAAAITIALARHTPGDAAAEVGWDCVNLSADSLGPDGSTTARYELDVPAVLEAPVARVCLCWNSRVISDGNLPTRSELSVDLDLSVFDQDGTKVASSASYDNSYELAQFYPVPGHTYQIAIARQSGDETVWCGLAWIVTESASAAEPG